MMRKSLIQGTKTDVIKRRAKELGLNVIDNKPAVTTVKDLIGLPVLINSTVKRIVTFNHPWVNQQ
jgi:hypothetical protein